MRLIAWLTLGVYFLVAICMTHMPRVPAELIAMENVVLLPHVGSASVYTRAAMGQLMFDNLTSWFGKGRPLTPVPETPFPPKKAG